MTQANDAIDLENTAETPAMTLEEVKAKLAAANGVITLINQYGFVIKLSGVMTSGNHAQTGEHQTFEFPSIDTSEGVDLIKVLDTALLKAAENAEGDKTPEEMFAELLAVTNGAKPEGGVPKSKDEMLEAALSCIPQVEKAAISFKVGHFSVGSYGKSGYEAAFSFDNMTFDLNAIIALVMKAVPMVVALDS